MFFTCNNSVVGYRYHIMYLERFNNQVCIINCFKVYCVFNGRISQAFGPVGGDEK